jgi:hypothetical protein
MEGSGFSSRSLPPEGLFGKRLCRQENINPALIFSMLKTKGPGSRDVGLCFL